MNEDYLSHIDRLIRQRPRSGASLRSYGALADLMIRVQPKPAINAECANARGKDAFPLFSRRDLPLDFHGAALLLNRFFKYLSGTKRKDRTGLANALKRSEKDSGWNRRLFSVILEQDEKGLAVAAEEAGLEPQTLFFLGKTALRPSLAAFRGLMEKRVDGTSWDHGHCPLCGSRPDMARFAKQGKRFLHCELCGTQWHYPRIGCPFCGNRDAKSLGYFEAEGEEGVRVYFCDACRRYLKTMDARVFEPLAPLELEGLATLHLDLAARARGYR